MTEVATIPSPVSRVPSPGTIGQATAVEQARAEAEVKAAVVVAQQCPRDVAVARAQMIESCEQRELAQRAFFRYNRAGSQITGASIHLAREIARCWGNFQYGIAEMRRDDVAGESEMMAFAWDVQTNTRSTSTFIVPHKRDKRGGSEKLTETRDIYENNANMGARRVREAIFALLPTWFVEQAKAVCNATIERGDGSPLSERITNMIAGYDRAGVTKKQLEDKVGLRSEHWTAKDVAALTVVWNSLVAHETTIDEEFPTVRSDDEAGKSGAERMRDALGMPPQTEEPTPEPPADESDSDETPGGASKAQLAKIGACMRDLGITDAETKDEAREKALDYVAGVIGHGIASRTELTKAEAHDVIERLAADMAGQAAAS